MTPIVVSNPKPMLVLNRPVRLAERGKIKIGMKGPERTSNSGKAWQPPVKLDHFLVTTTERGKDGNFVKDEALHEIIGAEPTEIPVVLLWNDPLLSWQSRYAAYKGKTLWCSGNGQDAMRGKDAVECPCERIEQGYKGDDKCKINGILSVMIVGAPGVGGVWKFRTTSFNSVDALTASIMFLHSATGGQLAGIPLWLTVRPKQATDPEGKAQTIYVVNLEYRGSQDELQDKAQKIALGNATARLNIERAEQNARLMLEASPGTILPGDDPEDVRQEFYPHTEGQQTQQRPAKAPFTVETGTKPLPKPPQSSKPAPPAWPPSANGMSEESWNSAVDVLADCSKEDIITLAHQMELNQKGKWTKGQADALRLYVKELMEFHGVTIAGV